MKLVLFDFDGTLTTKDSFIEFIKFSRGTRRFFIGFFLLSPILILYKIRIIPNWKAKESVLTYFFKGMSLKTFQNYCNDFALDEIENILRPEAVKRLLESKSSDSYIWVISASAENWIKPWTDKMNIKLIGTKLGTVNDKISGQISGKNCYGSEKVRRIKEMVDITGFDEIEVYGDSKGDLELMKIATKRFYKVF